MREAATAPTVPTEPRRRGIPFGLALAGIALLGFAVRLYYALHVMGHHRFGGDGQEFHYLARVLAERHAYVKPFPQSDTGSLVQNISSLERLYDLNAHARVPTAEKPPLYPAYLAVWVKLGLSSFRWNMVASSVLGAGTVAVTGLIGRRAAGARVGLIAAALAAVYLDLVLLDGSVRSESLYVLLVALSVLAAYRMAERPSVGRAALFGVAIGLAALTRSEALILIGVLAVPAVLLAPGARRDRLRTFAVVCAGCAVIVLPWLARNWIAFDRPTPISTNVGGLLDGANCRGAYYGPLIGAWGCFPQPLASWGTNESVVSGRLQGRALRYARDHAGRVPAVVGVRLLRTWELWKPARSAPLEAAIGDRDHNYNRIAQRWFWAMALLAIAGAVVLRRRGAPLRFLLALPVLVSIVAATSYGSTRFRAAAEIAIVVLAAAALDAAWPRIRAAILARRAVGRS